MGDGHTFKGVLVQGRLINDKVYALFLQPFDDTLDGGRAEIITAALHGEAVNAHPFWRKRSDMVCNVLLSGLIGLHHRADHGFRHIPVIGQKLLRILGQAVAAVAEGRIIVEIADAGIIAHALDDIGGVQPFVQSAFGARFRISGSFFAWLSISMEQERAA